MTENNSYILILHNETKPIVNTTRYLLIAIKVLLIPVLFLIKIPYYGLLAALLAIVSIIEYRALKWVPSISFSPEHIVFNGILKKKHAWSDISNVILKDDLLTIDFKNNRLFQKEIQTKQDEQEFNDWCRKNYTN